MRAFKPVLAGSMSLVLLAGSAGVVAQDEAPDPYLAGALVGTLAPDFSDPYGCGPITLPDGSEIPPVTMLGNTTGLTTLLGESTMTSMNCYSPADVMANIPESTFTLTGENGDELSGTWTGDCAPSFVSQPTDTYLCYGLLTVTDGTGTFDGATGQIAMMSEHWYAGADEDGGDNPMPTAVRLEGLIEYSTATAE
jgi:hypothetical protein